MNRIFLWFICAFDSFDIQQIVDGIRCMDRIFLDRSNHSSSQFEENHLADFMRPGSYEFTLQQIEQSFQLFPPFNNPKYQTENVESDKPSKTKPYIEHFARLNSPISTIQAFPFDEWFAIGTINTIYIASNKLEKTISFPADERTIFENIDVHPSSMILACDAPPKCNSIRIVNIQNNSTVMTVNKHARKITSVFFLPSVHKIFTTGLDGNLIISDLIKKKESYRFDKYESKESITAAAMKDEELISVGFESGLVGLFDNRDEGMIELPCAHSDYVNSISFASSKRHLATTSLDHTLKVWDLRNYDEPLFQQDLNDINISKTFFINDAIIAGTSTTGKLLQWDVANGNLLRIHSVRPFGIFSASIQRDMNRVLLSSEDNVISMLYY